MTLTEADLDEIEQACHDQDGQRCQPGDVLKIIAALRDARTRLAAAEKERDEAKDAGFSVSAELCVVEKKLAAAMAVIEAARHFWLNDRSFRGSDAIIEAIAKFDAGRGM